jgi:hypothetical protein
MYINIICAFFYEVDTALSLRNNVANLVVCTGVWGLSHAFYVVRAQHAVGKRIPDSVKIFPQGSKLVQFTHETGVALELNPTQCANSISQLPKFALIGIAREPLDFVLCACTLAHPVLCEMQLGGLLLKPMKVVTNWDSGVCNAASHKAWCA